MSQPGRERLDGATEPDEALRDLCRQILASLLRAEFVRLRRLVIAEADRFPDLAKAWSERGFDGGDGSLVVALRQLVERELLHVEDVELAAQHLAGLVVWAPLNQAMFGDTYTPVPAAELERGITAGVRVFLARYRAAT